MADTKTETPVQVISNVGEVQGQAQAKDSALNPHDGKHQVDETVVVTDKVITDANHELAVQIPEEGGASTAGHRSPLGEAYEVGTPQEQFDRDQEEAEKQAKEDAKKS